MNSVTVVSVGDTSAGVIDELAACRGRVTIVRRCPELAQLLAACQGGLAQVAVVVQFAGDLTATLVDRLTAVGVSVVAVAASPEEASRLRSLGACVVSGHITAESLSAAVLLAVASRRHHLSSGFAVPAGQESGSGTAGLRPEVDAAPSAFAQEGARAGGPAGEGREWPSGDAAEPLSGQGAAGSKAADVAAVGQLSNSAEDKAPPPQGGDAGEAGKRHTMNPAAAHHDPHSGQPRTGFAAPFASGRWQDKRTRRGNRRKQKTSEPSTGAKDAPNPGERSAEGSTLVAVWGPIGSPGRTTVAINLAAEQASMGRTVMLIDADSFGASVAAALGLLDESASFAQACRVADQGLLSAVQLSKIATSVVFSGGSFSLLTGLTRPDRWTELRAAAVQRVLSLAKEMADLVIVDCGFSLENDEELSYDTVAPRRNAATLMVLSQADIIYAVGKGDPVGIPRLIRGLAELARHCPGADVRVVVNKVFRKAVGAAPEKALTQAWERFGPSQTIDYFLPWDPELAAKALLEGRLFQEVAPDAPLRKAIRTISCAAVQRIPENAVRNATAKL